MDYKAIARKEIIDDIVSTLKNELIECNHQISKYQAQKDVLEELINQYRMKGELKR